MPAVECDHCGSSYRVHAKLAGKRVKCRDCGQPLAVPRGEGPIVATPRPAAATKPLDAAPRSPRSAPVLPPLKSGDFFSGFTGSAASAASPARPASPPPLAPPLPSSAAHRYAPPPPVNLSLHEPQYLPRESSPTDDLADAVESRRHEVGRPPSKWTGGAAQAGAVGTIIVALLIFGLRIYLRVERNAARNESRQQQSAQDSYERREEMRRMNQKMIDDMEARREERWRP